MFPNDGNCVLQTLDGLFFRQLSTVSRSPAQGAWVSESGGGAAAAVRTETTNSTESKRTLNKLAQRQQHACRRRQSTEKERAGSHAMSRRHRACSAFREDNPHHTRIVFAAVQHARDTISPPKCVSTRLRSSERLSVVYAATLIAKFALQARAARGEGHAANAHIW